MMWFSLSDQTAYFLWSVVFGAALGVLYDAIKMLRLFATPKKSGILISDVLFCVFCGVLTSLFALPLNRGGVRWFGILGEVIGFLVFRLTVGTVTPKIHGIFVKGIKTFFGIISDLLKKIYNLVLKLMHFVLYNIGGLIDKSAEKRKNRKRRRAENRKSNRKPKQKKDRTNERREKDPAKKSGQSRKRK